MKASLFVASGLFYALTSLAQPSSSLATLSSTTIRLSIPEPSKTNKPGSLFRHFEIVDQRPDTARIGIHCPPIGVGRPHNRQLVFTQPASQALSAYLDQNYAAPGATYNILIVLRNLWLSDANYLREEKVKNPKKFNEMTHLRVRMEIYATKDSSYMPLYRLDTLVINYHLRTYNLTTPYSAWNENLAALLDQMIDSATTIVQRKDGRTRLVSLEEIRQYNQTRFTSPIDSEPLQAGVYASFQEFKNNSPSIQNFEVKMEGNKRILYIREGKTSYYSHNAWGYCDGKNIFIMRDGTLCPTWREGNAWYFYGEADSETHPFTLDIDKGDIY